MGSNPDPNCVKTKDVKQLGVIYIFCLLNNDLHKKLKIKSI